jgi:hypothetical protein
MLQEKNMEQNFFWYLKTLKKGVGSGSGSFSQKYGSADPDLHQISRIPNTAYNCFIADCLNSCLGWFFYYG